MLFRSIYNDGAPSEIETSKGYLFSFKNYDLNAGNATVSVFNKNENKLVAERQVQLQPELVQNIRQYRRSAGLRTSAATGGIDPCNPQAREALDKLVVVANAAFCAMSIAALLTPAAPIVLIGGFNALLNCYGLVDGFVELATGEGVMEHFFGQNTQCATNGAIAGYELGTNCWKSITMSKKAILKCTMTLLDSGGDGLDCSCEKDKKATGGSYADPHLITPDGLYYSFQGFGEFIALKSTVDNFEVQVRQEGPLDLPVYAVNTAVGVQTGSDIVSIHLSPFGIYINGSKIEKPTKRIELKQNAYLESHGGSDHIYNIVTSNGDMIRVSSRGVLIDYEVFLNNNRSGKVEGLFGNFDGDKSNDLKIKGGGQIENKWGNLYPAYANSWRVKENFFFHYESGKNTSSHTVLDFPKKRPEVDEEVLKAARESCIKAGVTQEPFLSNCIHDVSIAKNPEFISSALTAQNNSSFIATSNEINEFKDIVLTTSRVQGTLTDTCLLDYTTGKVYQLKDGAQYASKIDAVLNYSCGLTLDSPAYINYCDNGCGLNRINNVLKTQKWSEFRTGAADLKLYSDNPFSENEIPVSEWANITTSSDLAKLSWTGANPVTATNYQFGSRIGVVGKSAPLGLCNPDTYFKYTLYRFITKEGRKGVFRLKDMIISPTGYKIIMDIKIQK